MRQTRIDRFADVHEALEVKTVVARPPKLAIAEGSAEHVDITGTNSVIAAVNADFDRTGSTWTSNVFVSPAVP